MQSLRLSWLRLQHDETLFPTRQAKRRCRVGERTKRRHRRLETNQPTPTMPHTPEPETIKVQTAQAVDPAAICSVAAARRHAVGNGNPYPMPGLNKMTKAQMAKALQDCWSLCDEALLPTHNTKLLESRVKSKGSMTLYGRLYCALFRSGELPPNVENQATASAGHRQHDR